MESITRIDWFNKLDEPYKSEAIQETDLSLLENKVKTLEGALFGGFRWSESKQGHDYWNRLYNKIIKENETKNN
jgi:hypothetical protein